MEASFAYKSFLEPCSQSALYLGGVNLTDTHSTYPALSAIWNLWPLGKAKAKVYVGATSEVSWGKQMERTGYDSSSLWKRPDSSSAF